MVHCLVDKDTAVHVTNQKANPGPLYHACQIILHTSFLSDQIECMEPLQRH